MVKRFVYTLILSVIGVVNAFGLPVPEVPKDPATLEALMALHKSIKSDEDVAKEKIIASFGEQSAITKGATKFLDARTWINMRLKDANSYVTLAAVLSSTAKGLYDLTQEYSTFISKTAQEARKKPFVLFYFAQANKRVYKEVEHVKKLYASMAISNLNLMYATMQQKFNILMTIKASITEIRGIIRDASQMVYLVTECNWRPDYVWEIINSEITDEITDNLKALWIQKHT